MQTSRSCFVISFVLGLAFSVFLRRDDFELLLERLEIDEIELCTDGVLTEESFESVEL